MINIFDFMSFDKTIAVYHGLGSAPNKDRNTSLNKLGFNTIYETHDYELEFFKDLGESFFKSELDKIKNCQLIIGLSFGGYIAYHLSKATGIPCLLINPALDRLKSKTVMNKHYVMNYTSLEHNMEIFCGELDKSVDPIVTKKYLVDNNDKNYTFEMVPKMAHRVPHIYWSQILKKSKLIK